MTKTESSPEKLFDDEEMRQFGYDPTSQEDRTAWLNTTPPKGTPIVSADDFIERRVEDFDNAGPVVNEDEPESPIDYEDDSQFRRGIN